MWKITFSIFISLTITIGGLLFLQWRSYSEELEQVKGKGFEEIHQEVSVESKAKKLIVKQKFSNLTADKEYRIKVPSSIKNWKCVKTSKKSCKSKDNNPLTFIAHNGEITIELSIPLNNKNAPFLFNDWLGIIPNTETKKSTVEIIDTANRKGSWVTGIPLLGGKKLDLISYFNFEGASVPGSLYWQPSTLQKKKYNNQVTIFYDQKKKPEFRFPSLKKTKDFPHLSIVMTNGYRETNGNGLIIVKKNIESKVLERKLVHTYYSQKFAELPLEEKWLLDVFTSFTVSQKSKTEKGNQVIKELKSVLTDEQLATFLTAVNGEKSPLTSVKLDEILSSLVGKGTHFFVLNKNEASKFIPIYFYDQRKVAVNNKVVKNVEVTYKEIEQLFPFVETMEALGFDVKTLKKEETILVSKDNNNYRFYPNRNIFIYNEENYGLLENPLSKINGRVYIKQQWLQSIFKVVISEDEKQITLTSFDE